MRKAQIRTLFAGLLVAVVCAATLVADHSWGPPYHWARTSNPFTLKLGDNLTTSVWKVHLAKASQDWNGNSPLITAIVAGTSRKRCSMESGTTQVCNGKYGFNGWLGLASINIIGGEHITQGMAKVNDSYFNLSTYNNPNERQHVMCQEVAHTFGLAHQSEDGSSQNSCMDYFSNTGVNAGSTQSTTPNAHDFEELRSIYAHVDVTTTLAAATSPAVSASDVSEDPNSWGQLVSQSKNGRSSTYEHFERDGSKTVTHVYWTLEAAANCPSCDHRFDR
jgi:hypothetical protein